MTDFDKLAEIEKREHEINLACMAPVNDRTLLKHGIDPIHVKSENLRRLRVKWCVEKKLKYSVQNDSILLDGSIGLAVAADTIKSQQEQIAELVKVIKNIKQGADYYMSDGFECAEDAYRYPGIVQTDCARALAKHQTQEEGK